MTCIIVDRPEDMSPTGVLTLIQQRDGDVIIVVRQTVDECTGRPLPEPREAQVEFCTYPGGGRSPRTLQALRALAIAMAQDNADAMNRAPCVLWNGHEFLETLGT